MHGTILEKIIKAHSTFDEIVPDTIIPIQIDQILLPDNSVMPIFDILESRSIRPLHLDILLALTTFPYQYTGSYSHTQARILKLGTKYGFKIIPNNNGLWFVNLLELNWLKSGGTFLGRASTVNFFAPLNSLNISAGLQDVLQVMLTNTHDYLVPEVINIHLEGELKPYVSGKDIALFLIRTLSSHMISGNYVIEFSGPLLDLIPIRDIFTLSLHHYNMNVSSFTFPELKQLELTHHRWNPESDAEYKKKFIFDLSNLKPLTEHNGEIIEVSSNNRLAVDKVFIGNSIGGTLSDIEFLSIVLQNRQVKVPCFVVPASTHILLEATRRGYLTPILESGCTLSTPATGITAATNGLIPLEGERVISTAINILSMQAKETPIEFFMTSIETAIASALTGYLCTMEEIDL